jgi:hypothetical protein
MMGLNLMRCKHVCIPRKPFMRADSRIMMYSSICFALEVAISAARRFKSGDANWGWLLGLASPPIHLTPATSDRSIAADWFRRFETASVDYDNSNQAYSAFCLNRWQARKRT